MLNTIVGLMTTAATLGGGIWLIWGVIVLAGCLKDHNGPQQQSGIWQIVGGGLIIAAVQLFAQLNTSF